MLLSWERNPRSVKKNSETKQNVYEQQTTQSEKKQRNSTSLELYGKQADNVGQFCLYSAGLANVHFINTCCKAAKRRKQFSALQDCCLNTPLFRKERKQGAALRASGGG